MEYQPHSHKIPWNFPWNPMEKYNEKNRSNVYEKFHGIPWNSMDSMENSMN
jgi:hypothetical protein